MLKGLKRKQHQITKVLLRIFIVTIFLFSTQKWLKNNNNKILTSVDIFDPPLGWDCPLIAEIGVARLTRTAAAFWDDGASAWINIIKSVINILQKFGTVKRQEKGKTPISWYRSFIAKPECSIAHIKHALHAFGLLHAGYAHMIRKSCWK